MRGKPTEKFKDRIRELTRRSRNFDAEVVGKVNQVIRGTANYFATPYSHNRGLFREPDRWIRMRLRCMNYKRKSKIDNGRLRLKHFRNRRLLNLGDFYATPA